MVDSSYTPAKKSLGQHWLVNDKALDEICELADLSEVDTVLEIGPGTGNLTKLLLSEAKQVIAVELDKTLVDRLEQLGLPNLQVINRDILSLNLNTVPKDYKLVANIPYYLTGKLIRQISETANKPQLAILLVQKEIAERLSANAGGMSILGLTCQYFYDVEKASIVPASSFDPPPKVDSQIIKLIPKNGLNLSDNQQKELFRLIRIGFASKRKTLLNNLASGYKLDKQTLNQRLESIGIDSNKRPQELSMSDWANIATIHLDNA